MTRKQGPHKFSVVALNLRDATYVLANLREQDWDELKQQIPRDTLRKDIANVVLPALNGPAYSVYHKDSPVAVFGVTATAIPTLFVGYAFGTNKFRRAAPFIARFGYDVLSHWLIDAGALRLEVRAKADHDLANIWLKKLGFNLDTPLKYYGSDGSTFNQYSMTVDDYYKLFPPIATEIQ